MGIWCRKAKKELRKQKVKLVEFSNGLDEDILAKWQCEVDDWEQGHLLKNPYSMLTSVAKMEPDVQLEYAKREAKEQKLGILFFARGYSKCVSQACTGYQRTPKAYMPIAFLWGSAHVQEEVEESVKAEKVSLWLLSGLPEAICKLSKLALWV
ncbi:hypothetical protein VNI00_011332 [Paramarasmius palmivorus]|uniref:Uncharacterized protein n=1 Tax=Paramarasmius palmivorus TaxID=297713 RepID=A0AAW0CB50_9AGAR